MTKMRTKLIKNLTAQERQALRRLTMPRMHGGMREWLDWLIKHSRGEYAESRVWWYENDGKVLAWAMTHPVPELLEFNRRNGWTEDDLGWWGDVYVRNGKSGEYRRRGYGSRLLAQMAVKHPDLRVSPHSFKARAFYAANGFNLLHTGRCLMRL